MKRFSCRTVRVLLLLTSMALPAAAARALEQGAILTVEGTTTVHVNGDPVAAATQGENAALNGSGFGANEVVSLWLTLPDGSVFGLEDDGLSADADGAFETTIGFAPGLATGLHQITARGQSSGHGAVAPFYLLPGAGPEATQGTRLAIRPEAPRQLETAEVTGSGFAAGELISSWLTLPDGAVVSLGQHNADADGAFARSLSMPSFLPVGHYFWTAHGTTSGNTAIARFSLQYGNGLDVPGASLAANIGRATQGMGLEVLASGFTPDESISFWLTQPNGAVLDLGETSADDDGNLSASFYLSETLPTGRYFLSLYSHVSKRGSFASLELEPGP